MQPESINKKFHRYLNGMMSGVEETRFLDELLSDSDTMEQLIVLYNRECHISFGAAPDDVYYRNLSSIKSLITKYINTNTEFDNSVDAFIRDKMSFEEAFAFISKSLSSVESQERAYFIALLADFIKKETKDDDLEIIESINILEKEDLTDLIKEWREGERNDGYIPMDTAAFM